MEHNPLTPADCDLRSVPAMLLDVQRFRDSDLVVLERPEAIVAAILLWGASWHQVPAASLPDDDRMLAQLAGYGRSVPAWKKVRAGALRGFVKCSDGRLYHPVVAEKAREMWDDKMQRTYGRLCAAVRKHNERHKDDQLEAPKYDDWIALGRPEKASDISVLSRGHKQDVTRTKANGHADVVCENTSNITELNITELNTFTLPLTGDSSTDVDLSAERPTDPPDEQPVTVQEIVEAWNQRMVPHGFPAVQRVTGTRLKHLKARIRENTVADFQQAMSALERSGFCRGENRDGWRADFDFFVQSKSFTKLLEGAYDH